MMKKRFAIIIIICFSLLFLAAAFLAVRARQQKENPENPLSIRYISDTMELCITVSDGYEFEGISDADGNGYLNIPASAGLGHSITLDVSAIPVSKSDLVTLAVQKADYCIYLTCKILHPSDSQFIVEVSQRSTGKTITYEFGD